MRTILFILLSVVLFSGCKSREEKVAELIKQDMFKTLYDFESYEPIETKIDSAFTSIYTDSTIIAYAYIARHFLDDVQDDLEKVKEAQRTAKIWSDSYSSYGRSEYEKAYNESKEYLEKVNSNMSIVNNYVDSIKAASSNFVNEFCGWKATHRFRCKTKGGNFDLGDYIYIFDKDLKRIIHKEDANDDSNSKIKSLIDEAIHSDEEDSIDAVSEATALTETSK